jgi:uncharacterized protein YjbI with pentapeptide repeats
MEAGSEKQRLTLNDLSNLKQLQGKNLLIFNAELSGQYLCGINFEGGALRDCNVESSRARRMNLKGCDLQESNFSFSDMRESIMEGSDI